MLKRVNTESERGFKWPVVATLSKVKFCGLSKLTFAVATTINVFNTGAASRANVLQSVGIEPGAIVYPA